MARPCSKTPEFTTNRVDARQAMQTLSYAEMVALAAVYTRWALEEPKLDGDQRTKLIESSSDYERIADFVGPLWRATEPGSPPNPLVFVARLELKAVRAQLNDQG